jgi:hypothetical protein
MRTLVCPPVALALLLAPAPGSLALGAPGKDSPSATALTRDRLSILQGRWRFEKDGTLLCEGSETSSLVVLKGTRARDLSLSVEVLFAGDESSAGLFFRAENERFFGAASFYQFEWYTRGHHHDRRLSLMTKNPRWKQIVNPIQREAPLGRWIRLRVRAVCDHLEAFVDDVRVFERRDRALIRAGRLGLHVFQRRPVRFRALEVELLDKDPAAAACR